MKTLETMIDEAAYSYEGPIHRNCYGCCQSDSDYIEAFQAGAKFLFKALSEIGIDGAKTINVGEPTDNPLLSQFVSYTQTAPIAAQILKLKQDKKNGLAIYQKHMKEKQEEIEQLEAENKRLNELFENIKNCIGEDDSEDKITLLLRAESAGKGTE